MQLHQAPDHLAHHVELQGGGVGLSIAPRAAKLMEVPQAHSLHHRKKWLLIASLHM